MSPRRRRTSGTWRCVPLDDGVEIGPEAFELDGRRVAEQGSNSVGPDETVASQRSELADGHPVAGHDEMLTPIQAAHDLPALVS